jgi:hypothetical protein
MIYFIQIVDGNTHNMFQTSWVDISKGLPTTGKYYGVDFGDIDNDLDLDLVTAHASKGVYVWCNEGLNNWKSASNGLPVSGTYNEACFGNINNDAFIDIACASGSGIHVWKGDGAGKWTDVSTNLPSSGIFWGVCIGDLDNDNDGDIVATTTSGVRAYRQNADGTWSSIQQGLPTSGNFEGAVFFVDVNADSYLDIIAAGEVGVHVYLGNGGTSWTESSTGLPTDWFTGISFGDINKDGNIDIAISSYRCVASGSGGNRVLAYKNSGGTNPTWTSISSGLPTVSSNDDIGLTDVNNDGNLDIVIANYSCSGGGIRIYLGDGGYSWVKDSANGLPTSGNYIGLDVDDVDNDGWVDIVATCGTGVRVWRNNTIPEYSSFISPTICVVALFIIVRIRKHTTVKNKNTKKQLKF